MTRCTSFNIDRCAREAPSRDLALPFCCSPHHLLTIGTLFRIKWKAVPLTLFNTGRRRWPHINEKKEITMQDKPVALVTGANKGIGLQIGKDLAAHGFSVGESQVISMRPRMPVIRTTPQQMRAEFVHATQPAVLKEKNRLAGEIPATSIVRATANKGVSRSFWAATYTGLLDLFTAPSMRDGEPRCMPSVAFTPSGPLVYQWRDARCL